MYYFLPIAIVDSLLLMGSLALAIDDEYDPLIIWVGFHVFIVVVASTVVGIFKGIFKS